VLLGREPDTHLLLTNPQQRLLIVAEGLVDARALCVTGAAHLSVLVRVEDGDEVAYQQPHILNHPVQTLVALARLRLAIQRARIA
jgi:hypothetical protein